MHTAQRIPSTIAVSPSTARSRGLLPHAAQDLDRDALGTNAAVPPALRMPSSSARCDRALASVNDVVSAALGTWNLPERVRRLALPSLLYDEVDLDEMSVVLVEAPEGGVAVAAWEAAADRDAVSGLRSVLLHGLYVTPRSQRQGLGTRLLELACHWMLARGFDAVTARVWRESEGFFRARGFVPLTRSESADSYPRRMWKVLR